MDRFAQVHEAMSTDLTVVSADATPTEVFDRLSAHRHRAALAVTDDRLVGLMTIKGALRAALYSPAVDASGRLKVGVAVGISGDVEARVEALLAAGADVLVMDTAHGHQERMITAVQRCRSVVTASGSPVPIVAGNVVTADGTSDLIEAGADVVKVGVGPGRHVHHSDADRRRPSAVLGGARMRRRRPATPDAVSGPTVASGIRATWLSPSPPAPER